jgi:hypothetical protein
MNKPTGEPTSLLGHIWRSAAQKPTGEAQCSDKYVHPEGHWEGNLWCPHPKPTVESQEWADKAYDAIQDDNDNRPTLEILREHFNAALAAERKKHEAELCQMVQDNWHGLEALRQQLAAEREKAKQAGQANIRTNEMLTNVRRERDKAERELAAERDKLIGTEAGCKIAIGQANRTQDKLDAERAKNKPLLDALEKITKIRWGWDGDCGAVDIASAALAEAEK